MTSDIGYGNKFLDMNYCVQVIGYAFTTSSDYDGEEEDCSGSEDDGSGSNSGIGSEDEWLCLRVNGSKHMWNTE